VTRETIASTANETAPMLLGHQFRPKAPTGASTSLHRTMSALY
jgi:hypothetical protein